MYEYFLDAEEPNSTLTVYIHNYEYMDRYRVMDRIRADSSVISWIGNKGRRSHLVVAWIHIIMDHNGPCKSRGSIDYFVDKELEAIWLWRGWIPPFRL